MMTTSENPLCLFSSMDCQPLWPVLGLSRLGVALDEETHPSPLQFELVLPFD